MTAETTPSAEHVAEARRHLPKTTYERVLLAALDHVAARLRARLRTTYSDVDRAELKDLLAYLGAGEAAS